MPGLPGPQPGLSEPQPSLSGPQLGFLGLSQASQVVCSFQLMEVIVICTSLGGIFFQFGMYFRWGWLCMRFVSVAAQVSFILGGALKGLAETPRSLAGGGRIDVQMEGHMDNFPLYE